MHDITLFIIYMYIIQIRFCINPPLPFPLKLPSQSQFYTGNMMTSTKLQCTIHIYGRNVSLVSYGVIGMQKIMPINRKKKYKG